MLVYVTPDDSLRTELVKIDQDSPPHHKQMARELPDDLVARYQKADNEYEEVQRLVRDFLDRENA